jgi:hypothetical protein
VTRIDELGTTSAATEARIVMEAIHSSETSVPTKTTRREIPEDGDLPNDQFSLPVESHYQDRWPSYTGRRRETGYTLAVGDLKQRVVQEGYEDINIDHYK